ncbi:prolipoprotein diacylglyceryl transferase [Patescibacteria group bacterium]|nr:prolipoprotein diacylglyceryl transferase [Patescibacteria group bacterium]MBU1922258.1 prolipoprotein diacylglyceryl transferase [Patescibacteria group bacterium]
MIPYFDFTSFSIGPVTLQVWGFFVSLGFIAAIFLTRHILKRKKLKHELVWDFALAALVGAIVGARLFHVIFYEWPYFKDNLLQIFYLWQPGYSFFGGFAGAALAFFLVYKIKKIDFWPYVDAVMFSLPLGLFIGRLGCAFIHDHPGVKTNFFLGVKYADHARWDLGLMQSLVNLVLFIVFVILARRARRPGFYAGIFFVYYALTRFALDFLRIWDGPMAETRYFSLTPAQYFSILLLAAGIIILVKVRKKFHASV